MSLIIGNLQPFSVVLECELQRRFSAGAIQIVGQLVRGEKVAHVVDMLIQFVIERDVETLPRHHIDRAAEQDAGQREDGKVAD
ncbi:MAG: hypothetical protein ABSD70_00550 [Terracidiphilus sp.]